MSALFLLAVAALAGNPEPFAHPGEDVEPDIVVASPRDLLDEARRRMLIGDYEGARIVAEQSLQRPGDHELDAQYLIGMGWEYDGEPERALDIYEGLLEDWPEGESTDDVVFRKAEALGRDKRYDEALSVLGTLGDPAQRKDSDRVKMELLKGLWEVELGDTMGGVARLVETLDTATVVDSPWHQAMARGRILTVGIDQADLIAFKGRKKKKARQLEERGTLVGLAEQQLVAIIGLDRPVWALHGFVDLAHGYLAFGQAMLDESKPRVKKSARSEYEQQRKEMVTQVWVKASKRLDRGIQYAHQVGWTTEPLDKLETDYAEVMAAIEAL